VAEKDILQDSLLREIDEELRQERYAKLWKKYGNLVIAAAVALVIGVAGFKGWQYWDQKTRLALSDRFTEAATAANSGNIEQALKAFSTLATDGNRGYALLARFQEASLLRKDGKSKEAMRVYQAIAGDGGADPAYRDLATLMTGYLALELNVFADVESSISQLGQKNGPWRPLARELLGLAAFKRGDMKAAREIYAELSKDAEAPSGVRSRANEMIGVLGS